MNGNSHTFLSLVVPILSEDYNQKLKDALNKVYENLRKQAIALL